MKTKAQQVARRAYKEAGVEPTDELVEVLADRIEIDDDGVRGTDGRAVWDHLQDLRADPAFRADFERLRPSHHGKDYGEMTLDEKADYIDRKYADLATPWWGRPGDARR